MNSQPFLETGGYFYFIKWKQGLLVADRAIQCKISAQTINKAGYYEGSKYRLLSSEECDSICIDDFNGSGITVFKSLNKWTNDWDQKQNIVLLQNGKNEKNNEGRGEAGFKFTEVVNTVNFSNRGSATALFLPCMEYVDSSKSTNIFY